MNTGSNRFDFNQIQELEQKATIERMTGTVLLIQDTSDINLNGHKKTEGLGYCSEFIRGIKIHSCIAVSTEGIPLGIVAQYYETRQKTESTLTIEEKKARPIEEKESYRWLQMLNESTMNIPTDVKRITICDREGDFYELYAKALESDEDFVIRVTHDRKSEDDAKTMQKIRQIEAIGTVIVNIPRDNRRQIPARQTEMEIAYCTVTIQKPKRVHQGKTPSRLTINLVRITELTPVSGYEPIEWILATNLTLSTASDVMTVVEYYIQRWKIERFHYVLKSGLNAEKIQQRTYERIKPLLFIYSVIALYIMAVTYIGRLASDLPCNIFFDDNEWKTLYRLIEKKAPPDAPYSMAAAVLYLGELGSYKRAPSDGNPGLKSIWKGLFRLYQAIVVANVLMGQV